MIQFFIKKQNISSRNKTSVGFTPPNTSAGFTLVELMVSLTIFSIVMMVSVGTLLIMVDVNAKAQALYTATTNLSFALDNMTRELRMGYNYYCQANRPGGVSGLPIIGRKKDCNELGFGSDYDYKYISFMRERDGFQVAYFLEGGVIKQKINDPGGSVYDVNWTGVTSPDVVIEKFQLFVDNTDSYLGDNDTEQPYVNMIIEGYVNNGLETNTDFSIQSRIIQRRLDLI